MHMCILYIRKYTIWSFFIDIRLSVFLFFTFYLRCMDELGRDQIPFKIYSVSMFYYFTNLGKNLVLEPQSRKKYLDQMKDASRSLLFF